MVSNQDLMLFDLLLHASLVVKLVLILLVLVSLISWYWIFRKWFAVRIARSTTDEFESKFWSGVNLKDLCQEVAKTPESYGSIGRIFESGFLEFSKLREQSKLDTATLIAGVRRAMRATLQREVDDLESHLDFLATVGSVSPYVGLFGTVWGIMHSFRGLISMSSATLAAVAPGIAEALIATAIGLFAAIPAVVAYNNYVHSLDRLSVRFETFLEEFANILQRQIK